MRFHTVEDLERAVKTVEDATAKAKQLMISERQFDIGMGAWNRAVGWLKNCRAYKRKHPDPRQEELKYLANDLKDAVAQAGYQEGSADFYFDGYMFEEVRGYYEPSKSKRDWHPIATSRLVSDFQPGTKGVVKAELKREPKGPVKVIIGAYAALSKLRLSVNGSVAFEGAVKPTNGEGDAPKFATLELPATAFKRGVNEIELTNSGRGAFALVYMVVRP